MKQATELEINAFELLKSKKFNDAYVMITLYKAQKNYADGLNIAQHLFESANKGLSQSELAAFQTAYDRPIKLSPIFHKFENEIRAMSILAHLYVINYYVPSLFKKLSAYIGFNQKITSDMKQELYKAERSIACVLNVLMQLESFGRNGFHYKILFSNDNEVCEQFKSMQEKYFKPEDAEIGVNCPPFHDSCRCFVVPHYICSWEK